MRARSLLFVGAVFGLSPAACGPETHAQSPIRPRLSARHAKVSPSSVTTPSAPRIYSKRRHTWIRARPSTASPWIGYLGLGGSVALRDEPPVKGEGCKTFYPVQPRGFVCLNRKTTLDATDSSFVAISRLSADLDTPFPLHYGESRQVPRYTALPSAQEQKRREFRLDDHLTLVRALREGSAPPKLPPLLRNLDMKLEGRPPPPYLSKLEPVWEHRPSVPAGSVVSWVESFDAGGRSWLVSGDGALMPKDKVFAFPRFSFHGVVLGKGNELPLAFVREKPRQKYQRNKDGTIVPHGGTLARLSHVGLTGKEHRQDRKTYLETRDGFFMDRRDATVIRPSPFTPWGETIDLPSRAEEKKRWSGPNTSHPKSSRATWIEISVHEGWLIAYEGKRPVFATLAASGLGKRREGSRSGQVQTSTPPGVFRLQGKYWTSTMSVNDKSVHFDVPFALPFHGAYGIHAAPWHDRWGEKISFGCINLSPRDARWIFVWAEPTIHPGWYGMRFDPSVGPSTVVVVHA